MAKKSFYDFLPEDVQKKTGLKTGAEAFYFLYSPSFRQKKAKEMGFVEVAPKVYEKPKTKNTTEKKEPSQMLKAKRKGKSYSILNTAMGLTDSIKTKKKTLLG
jgi:hypothetical protein